MNRYAILAALGLAGAGGDALAADLDVFRPTPIQQAAPGTRWDGFSVGVNGGGLWAPGQSETQVWFPPTIATPGIPNSYKFSASGGMVGAQTGFSKQWGSFVAGAVADYDFAIGGTTKQTAAGLFGGTTFSTAQSQQLQSLGTIRGRLGFTPIDSMLLYATGGLAFGQTRTSTSLGFGTGAAYSGAHTDVAVGYAIGAGLEYALDPQWSIGAEFLYYNLGDSHVVGTANFIPPPGFGSPPETDSAFAFQGYTLRLGLNYEFDGSSDAPSTGLMRGVDTDLVTTMGVRAGMSTSSARTKLYDFTGSQLISQLTYHNPTAATAEFFGRLDETTSGLFMKGFAGIGKETGGSLQDEDFPPLTLPYSSTNSPQSDGRVSYGAVDFGYYGLQGGWYKLGGLVGFHYLDERFNAFGCTQTAGNTDICSPGQVGAANLGISDEGRWDSVRLGLAGELKMPSGFSARAEAVWLPYMAFNGGNDHWLRVPADFSGAIPESGSGSNGVQLEGEINYALGNNFDIGVGGRYWSMNAKGHMAFQNVTAGGGAQVATFETQRSQAFVQSAYHF